MITLGENLKSDTMIEYLEMYSLDVNYNFDRLFEGEDDSYTVINKTLGIEMKFDSKQRLCVVWIKDVMNSDARKWMEWTSFSSKDEVKNWAESCKFKLKSGPNWIRADAENVCYHYEFDLKGLAMVTLMSRDVAP